MSGSPWATLHPSPLQAPSSQVSGTLAGAFQQLHPDGNADVPAQRDQPDEAGNDGRPQQVLDCGSSVRVSIEDLKKGVKSCLHHSQGGKGRLIPVWSWPQFVTGKSQKVLKVQRICRCPTKSDLDWLLALIRSRPL